MMVTFMKKIAAAAALSVVVVPATTMAAPVEKLSVAKSVRAPTQTRNASQLRGGFVVPLIATIAIILGIILVANDDDGPNSP